MRSSAYVSISSAFADGVGVPDWKPKAPQWFPELAILGERDEGDRAFECLDLHRRDRGQRRLLDTAVAELVAVEVVREEERRQWYQLLPGKVVLHEGDPALTDAAVNEAYDNAGITYEFFDYVFGRRLIDGKDMGLLSSVHYSKHYDDAFWGGKQMVSGDGDGDVFGSFTKAIDVIANERG